MGLYHLTEQSSGMLRTYGQGRGTPLEVPGPALLMRTEALVKAIPHAGVTGGSK